MPAREAKASLGLSIDRLPSPDNLSTGFGFWRIGLKVPPANLPRTKECLPVVEIYVDADACPVKEEVVRVADRYGLSVHMVSNAFMRLPQGKAVNQVIVSDGFDAADDWIAENIKPKDIAITADVPLAARCVESGAFVLGPTGKDFSDASIGMDLAMRNLNQHLRESGEIKGGGAPFTKKDRSTFLSALDNAVTKARR